MSRLSPASKQTGGQPSPNNTPRAITGGSHYRSPGSRLQVKTYILQGFVIRPLFSLKLDPFHWRWTMPLSHVG